MPDLDPDMVRQRLGELGSADSEIRHELTIAARELRDELHSLVGTVRDVRDALGHEVEQAAIRFAEQAEKTEVKNSAHFKEIEGRISSLEKWRWMTMGIIVAAVVVAPYLDRHWPW